MNAICRAAIVACFFILLPSAARAAAEATLFRLFLTDGTSLVSFGEYARIDDRVIFSMPVGGPVDDPRLFVVSLAATRVDWDRTERYSSSARYDWYAATRGEADFARMSTDVARVLNEVATSGDRRSALAMAENARRTLATWPGEHFGYRQADVREIVGLLDESISTLRASVGIREFELELVSTADVVIPREPLLGMPSAQEQLDQVFRLAAMTDRSRDRVALLHAALALVGDPRTGLSSSAAAALKVSIAGEIREEAAIDSRYAAMSRRLLASATKAAASARISDVERILTQVAREDRRLGGRRPEEVAALRASVQMRLDGARRLQLLRERWTLRRALYRDWQRSAGVHLLRLVKERSTLEGIRRMNGPSLDTIESARRRLSGGADRLSRIGINVPGDLRAPHDLLVGAWRFAENALNARYEAAAAGNLDTARQASAAAAGALLMLDRAQADLRTLLEPPTLR